MKNFTYHGQQPHCVTLKEQGDTILLHDQVYQLDETNGHIQALIALGHLKEVAEPEEEKKVSTNKIKKT